MGDGAAGGEDRGSPRDEWSGTPGDHTCQEKKQSMSSKVFSSVQLVRGGFGV